METLVREEIKQPSLNNDGTRSAWLEEGIPLLLSAMSSQWDIGDWAMRTPAEASRNEIRELLEEAANRTGYDVNSIRDLRTVAGRIPPQLRKSGLSWYAYRHISKLSVTEGGKVSEEKSLALRAEFIDRFAALPDVGTLEIRSAVQHKMGKSSAALNMETISFKLTTPEFAHLNAVVEADPIHESVADFVQELVRKFLASTSAVCQ